MFMRLGTPSGLRMMSTGVPSGRYGMSSCGRIFAITPLLPWRPAILSPTLILRFCATRHPDQAVHARLEVVVELAPELADLDDLAALAVRQAQRGVLHLARLLTEDRAQEALLRRQLGLALGRDLADEDVAGAHLGADVDDALLVEVLEGLLADVRDVAGDLLGPELGVAGLELVLLDVDAREEVVLDEAIADDDRVLVVAAFPGHERREDVAAEGELAASPSSCESAMAWPSSTRWPTSTMGRWLMHVPWLLRTNFWRRYSSRSPSSVSIAIRSAVTLVTTPGRLATMTWPESRAARSSMPVPTIGASGSRSGTAWRCMFEPMRARLASSCSRNGMSAVATETTCLGDTSMYSTWPGRASGNVSR